MEGEREGDIRVPLISSLFCIFVITGGVFLALYAYVPSASQPWYPVIALILIGSPWIFWLFTYMYTCAKACCRRSSAVDERQVSRRASSHAMARPSSMSSNHSIMAQNNNAVPQEGSPVTSPSGGERHVHFGQVVVMEGEDTHGGKSRDHSISSSKEIEMPLNTAPAS